MIDPQRKGFFFLGVLGCLGIENFNSVVFESSLLSVEIFAFVSWRCEFVIGSTEQFQFKFLSINWCDKHNPSPSVWEVQVILSGEVFFRSNC